jgi:hypothetical protein
MPGPLAVAHPGREAPGPGPPVANTDSETSTSLSILTGSYTTVTVALALPVALAFKFKLDEPKSLAHQARLGLPQPLAVPGQFHSQWH